LKRPRLQLVCACAAALGVLAVTGTGGAQEPTPAAPAPGEAPAAAPGEPAPLPQSAPPDWAALVILDEAVEPGQRLRLALPTGESFTGSSVGTPLVVTRGVEPGPTVCLVGGIHGDELIGVEVVRQVMEEVEPQSLRGTLIGLPIANPYGFRRSSRYLPDRRDLNRYFPGRERGSAASRIAYQIFEQIVRHCGFLVDFHTGSFHRTNLPQIRADVRYPAVAELARKFGSEIVVHSIGQFGTLRRAAVEAGIPSVTYEAGEPMRFASEEIRGGVFGVWRLLRALEMSRVQVDQPPPQRVYYQSRWVRADEGGILLTRIPLGARVSEGDVLGTITDPISSERSLVRSPVRGRVIGMAINQVVIPGFAAFHVALRETDLDAAQRSSDGDGSGDGDDIPSAEPLESDLRPEE
jgi:predicted deacylase